MLGHRLSPIYICSVLSHIGNTVIILIQYYYNFGMRIPNDNEYKYIHE